MPSPAAESSAPDACTYDKFDVARDSDPQVLEHRARLNRCFAPIPKRLKPFPLQTHYTIASLLVCRPRRDALKRASASYLENKAVTERNALMATATRTLPPA